MPKGITIRTAEPSDVPRILDYIRRLAEYEHLSHEVVATEALLTEWIFEKGKAEVLLADADGAPAGFALFCYNFSTFLGRAGIHLEDLFVLPEQRGKGVGHALICRIAEITVERGCGRLEWACLDWNTPAMEFYSRLGAERLEDWTTYRLSDSALRKTAMDSGRKQD